MKSKTFAKAEAESMAPLLQSITREIDDRTRAVSKLERGLRALESHGNSAGETFGLMRSQLSTEARELRAVRREVEHLGLAIDDGPPTRIVVPCEGGDWVFEGSLDGTNFRRLEETRA